MLRYGLALAALLWVGSAVIADQVVLTDGSVVLGRVVVVTDDQVVIDTEFAGQIKIDASKVRGISTDQPVTVELKSGDRAVGRLRYTTDGSQTVASDTLGSVDVQVGQVSSVWTAGDESPAVVALKARLAKVQDPWSLRLHFGIDGQTGNTDRVATNGRMEIKRVTETDRLLIYAQGRSSRENGQDTVKEVLGGLNLEVDIDERWYSYGRTEIEFDKFEDLDLRTSVSGGLGYFVTREADEEFKVRAGFGFVHESFDSGASDDQAVADLGWDYRKDVAPWLLFTHSVTLYPTFEDIKDIRAVMENAAEIPLSTDDNWKLRIGVRNNYDAMPERGIDRLDTYYFFNVVVGW